MKTIRFFLSAVLALALVLSTIAPVSANEINVTIEGQPVIFPGEQGAVIMDGRTLVPIRGVFEMLDFDVDWHDGARTILLTSADYEILIIIGSDIFLTNGLIYNLDVPAQIINGRTMLPIRSVLESVGHSVGWDSATRTVLISTS